jgi:hypothetical protein
MSKSIKNITIVILSILTVLFGVYTVVHFFFNYKSTTWFIQDISNNNYTIIAEEVGTPWWYGDSKVLITIKDNEKGRFITSFSCQIDNEGNELSETNYNIEDSSEYVKLSFFDNNGILSSAYRFYYSDFNN